MIVAKFGGTSVSTAERIENIADIVNREIGNKPVVVVSALSGITDKLLSLTGLPKNKIKNAVNEIKDIHTDLIKDIWKKEQVPAEVIHFIDSKLDEVLDCLKSKKCDKESSDKLVSYGEILSSYIIATALRKRGINARQIIANGLIVTNDTFGSAEFLPQPTRSKVRKNLLPLIKKGIIPVITGFIASTESGKTTTLGRGGSDYTASIIGYCLNCDEIQIWTDVNGIYTADPRFLKKAKILPSVSFREASELATFGARVLHPRTIKPAIKAGIPVKVLNTFNLKSPGTLIVSKSNLSNPITAIAFKNKITLVNIYSTEMLLSKGFLAHVFDIFSKNNISVDLVSVSEVSVSVTLDNDENLKNAVKELSKSASVTVTTDLGMVSLVGEGLTSSCNIIHRIFDLLDQEKILVRMVSLGATDINISLVIQSKNVENAVKILHDRLLMKVCNFPAL